MSFHRLSEKLSPIPTRIEMNTGTARMVNWSSSYEMNFDSRLDSHVKPRVAPSTQLILFTEQGNGLPFACCVKCGNVRNYISRINSKGVSNRLLRVFRLTGNKKYSEQSVVNVIGFIGKG